MPSRSPRGTDSADVDSFAPVHAHIEMLRFRADLTRDRFEEHPRPIRGNTVRTTLLMKLGAFFDAVDDARAACAERFAFAVHVDLAQPVRAVYS